MANVDTGISIYGILCISFSALTDFEKQKTYGRKT